MTPSKVTHSSADAFHQVVQIGILGAGQLGAMLAEAADGLGFTCKFYSDSKNSPAGRHGPVVVGEYSDSAKLHEFGVGLSAVTYEFENIPAAAVEVLTSKLEVSPPLNALRAAQDRFSEKTLFSKLGIKTNQYRCVESIVDLKKAIEELGLPLVLKTRCLGYDGKGQTVITKADEAEKSLSALGGKGLIAEQFVSFSRELSLIAVASRSAASGPIGSGASKTGGEHSVRCYPLVQNEHREGILRVSRAPAPHISATLQEQASLAATKIVQELDYVGVLTIEFFECNGTLVANEMAPRVHNSGHWTIEGAVCSQFENHIRAIIGLPLGSTEPRGFSGMVNLIGDVPTPDSAIYRELLKVPGVHLHLYHKSSAVGRKVGHVTITASTEDEREKRLGEVCQIVQ